jgi:hypothetical protein
VIGADRTRSMVARHLNGFLEDRYAGYTSWRGIAAYPIHPDLAGETMAPGLEVGHVPLGPDHTYWFATERAPEGRVATVRVPESILTRHLASVAARSALTLPTRRDAQTA